MAPARYSYKGTAPADHPRITGSTMRHASSAGHKGFRHVKNRFHGQAGIWFKPSIAHQH